MTEKKSQEEILAEKYPILYCKDVSNGEFKSGVICGVGCPEGWIPIVDELSAKIEEYNNSVSEEDYIRCQQVKEKFGGLRFYVNAATEEIHKLISDCEKKSYSTCGLCGAEGFTYIISGWSHTFCDNCAKEFAEKRGVEAKRYIPEDSED